VATKGWKSSADILTSYQKLESVIGADKVVLPKDGDVEGEKAFRAKMGVPDTADKYDLKLPTDATVDQEFIGVAKGWMHEAGLTPRQAQIVAAKWVEYSGVATAGAATAAEQAAEQEMLAFEKEAGNKSDEYKAAAQRAFRIAAKPVGLDGEDSAKIVAAIGANKAMKLFSFFGSMAAEARYVDGTTGGFGGFTPEAALARMNQLKNDSAWRDRMTRDQSGAGPEHMEWKQLQQATARGVSP
jgi:hypothetical protein